MAPNKRPVKQEPLLNTVARTLGRAAGKVTKATHELAEGLSTLPGTVSTKLHGTADAGTPAKRPQATRQPQARRPKKKRIGQSGRARTAKAMPAAERQTSPKQKASRRKSQRSGA
jgi:hypothetical protein